MKGLDISAYQNGLSMQSVKKAGNEFVILRAGYTGYGANRKKVKDSSFEKFYSAAKSAGLNVGVYWYSCADSKEQGIAEANFLYENCLKGKQFEMPIYIDVENPRWQSKNKKGVTDAIFWFCETLEDKGYFVGVYASLSWFNNYIDTKRLDNYTKWVACWSSKKPSFKYTAFDMWQNSDNGRVDGVRVDTDIAYKDFPEEIKRRGKNGFSNAQGYTGKYPDTFPARGYYALGDGSKQNKSTKYQTQIKYIQDFMNWALGSGLVLDGHYGSLTANAVKKFQHIVGIKEDGQYGQITLAKAKGYTK